MAQGLTAGSVAQGLTAGSVTQDLTAESVTPGLTADSVTQDLTAGAVVPNLTIDPSLPIAAHQAEIAALLLAHPVVVVAGETGSGKTTQLPKIALAIGRERIGHTQPRRIAARAVATRLAEETGTRLGDLVGFQVRFTTQATEQTRLKIMTDGILLAEIAHDRQLRRYDTIIIDEAHERSLNIDFLLGYIKQLLPQRPDLKVIITSATIDTERFSHHFGDAPVVEVSGRGYPIEIRYAPAGDRDQTDAIVAALRSLPQGDDTLVFLAGEREIRDTATAIGAARLRDTEVLPLFARLSLAEQTRVFTPHTGRRVVLATNVAETSLTVPGIRCVIDPGFARISRFSARAKVQRLPIEPISRASADQRAGRCGRVSPGICVRLYSEDDYIARPEFTEPEILRTNLASVILAMTQARLGPVAGFPFLDAPDRRRVAEGVRLLTELGAVTEEPHGLRLTAIGRQLAQLPIDPALARIVVAGSKLGCLREATILAAALSIPDVRERPLDHRELADAAHARFGGPDGGDIGATLRLWRYLGDAQRDLSGNQFRKLCGTEFINYLRVREWQDLVSQLRAVTRTMKLHANSAPVPVEQVVKAAIAGLLSHVGALLPPSGQRGPREYQGARGARFAIAPDSLLAHTAPPLVLAVELVETSRLWAHGVAEIQPEWAEDAGGDLVKRSYSSPAFSMASRTVLAHEQTTLFGVPLTTDRRVDFARVDPSVARTIFIQSGLVEGQLTATLHTPLAALLQHNEKQLAAIDRLEVKTRRRGLKVDDASLAAWFDDRLPSGICSGAALESWLADARGHASRLRLSAESLLAAPPPAPDDYPDVWVSGPAGFDLDYRFEPGTSDDGVAIDVPLSDLAALDQAPFTWGVPGSRLEMATALIKGLPKAQRRHLAPAADFARQALDWLALNGERHDQPFTAELSRALLAATGQIVDGWGQAPDHLRPLFRVNDGTTIHASRDLPQLQASLARQTLTTLQRASAQQTKAGTTWVFDKLPTQVVLRRGGIEAPAFPALQDAVTAVRETFAATLGQARRTHRAGLGRLAALALPDPGKGVLAHLSAEHLAALATGPYASVPALLADARDGAIGALIDKAGDPWQVRDADGFDALVRAVRVDQAPVMAQIVDTAANSLRRLGAVGSSLESFPPDSPVVRDVRAQVDDLVFTGFLHAIAWPWLVRLPVWLQGVERRLEAALSNPVRDAARLAELEPVLLAFSQKAPLSQPEAVEEAGYLIEELRLQLFAQPLKPARPVSVKRLLTAIDGLPAA